eukprot:CAMPEP_0204843840 /NCGR_PEP_ID=MMETSP1346-20131115/48219_1 /ASSEMBLY_ACC=CAM_ASM_000771 /TAXON_ID=215587 /ORGANISM="Aplanochytrium stocchinoi, Strain GSBS06" /LENGTH=176 /DNA_ID=CAMNT_0051983061 /DNA_START=905 /DNA_END=1432 /DNA_ORIENTATION=+
MTNERPTASPPNSCVSCRNCNPGNTNRQIWNRDNRFYQHNEDMHIPDFNDPFEELPGEEQPSSHTLARSFRESHDQAGIFSEPLAPPPDGELFSDRIYKKLKTADEIKAQEASSQQQGSRSSICNHTPPCNATVSRSKNWSHKEEVVLVGVVFDRFFSQGSLNTNSSKKEDEACAW